MTTVKKVFLGISLVFLIAFLGAACGAQRGTALPVPSAAATEDATTDAVAMDDVADSGTPEAAVATPVVVKDENWEFTLPDVGWEPMKDAPETITRALMNDQKKNLILFVKEAFAGSFMQYAVLAVRELKQAGGHLLAARHLKLNGHEAILLEALSSNQSSKVWNWLVFDKGFGYDLSCAGSSVDATLPALCESIASTLKIN